MELRYDKNYKEILLENCFNEWWNKIL